MGDLKIDESTKEKSIHITLVGAVDEDTVFPKVELEGREEIIFDWKDVKSINSCGIREWIRWIEKIPNTIKILYLNCPRVIVNQIDMIKGFLPSWAVVRSFYVPYFCESCEHITPVLFSEGKEFTGETVNPLAEVVCESCSKATEIDVVPSKYFRFLMRRT